MLGGSTYKPPIQGVTLGHHDLSHHGKDPGKLEQAVLNLVKNAHESGSAPGDIEVRVRRLPGWMRLEVLDRGSGMPEAALESALVPFYSTKRTGTGLCLALAREIA